MLKQTLQNIKNRMVSEMESLSCAMYLERATAPCDMNCSACTLKSLEWLEGIF